MREKLLMEILLAVLIALFVLGLAIFYRELYAVYKIIKQIERDHKDE